MQNKYLERINMSTKILVLLIIIISILICKSLYLLLFISILVLIISTMANKNVNFYLEVLKNNFLWLLFFSIMYIIVFRNIYVCIILVYKLTLIIIILKVFISNIKFKELNSGIYGLLYLFRKTKLDIKKFSYNITIYLFYIIYFIDSKKDVKFIQNNHNKKRYGVKNYFIPRLFISINRINELEVKLALKFYDIKKQKFNFQSYCILSIFVIFFVMVIFKEVIL